MKKIILTLSIFTSLSAFALDAKPRIIATYTDLYNDDDLVAQCLVFSDGSAMKLFDGLAPYHKPEEIRLSSEVFKGLNDALDEESVGGIDKKTRKCNESVTPLKVLGKAFDKDKNKLAYVTGESRNVFYKELPACWLRKELDHVSLSTSTKIAALLKEACGFKDQDPDL